MQTPWEKKTHELIEEICQTDVVSEDCEPIAKTITERYFEDDGSGKAPKTIAATTVRIARGGKDWATQEEIADVAGVSNTQMSAAYPDLRPYADDLVP